MKHVPARYLFEGDTVMIPWPTPERPRQGLRVEVICVAGNHARVRNEKFEVDTWRSLEQLYVPEDSPRAGR